MLIDWTTPFNRKEIREECATERPLCNEGSLDSCHATVAFSRASCEYQMHGPSDLLSPLYDASRAQVT